jgi:hypothetical protein
LACEKTRTFDMDNLNDARKNYTLPLSNVEAPLIMLVDLESGAKDPVLS